MRNFEFKNPVKIIFGEGQISKLAKEIPTDSRILMTYGGGSIKKNGVYKQTIEALDGYTVFEFGGIEANPDYDTLMKAVEVCKNNNITYILAVGGGSVIDGSKFISAAAFYEGDCWDMVVNRRNIFKAIPLATILTLPATASEMNEGAVISRRELKEKFAFSNPLLFPKFSILDPTVIYSLPKKQIANGIVDTFAHILEQYLTTTDHYMVTDRLAEGILKNLIDLSPNLLSKDELNYNDCANYMLSATLGLNGWTAMGAMQDWATHLIGHELTALTGLDHGETLAIVYPGTMKIMSSEKKGKLLQYASRVWNIVGESDEEIIEEVIYKTEEFFNLLGIKTHLSEKDIEKSVIDIIVNRFEERKINIGEKGIVTPKHIRMILESQY